VIAQFKPGLRGLKVEAVGRGEWLHRLTEV
jgi:hypothetical protein